MLQAIDYNGKKYTFRNTCPFDSFMQVMLIAGADFPQAIQTFTELQEKILMFKLIKCILKQGFQASTYRKQGTILKIVISKLDPGRIENAFKNSYLLPCHMNLKVLVSMLPEFLPSFEVTSTCNENCSSVNTKPWGVLVWNYEDLVGEGYKKQVFPLFEKHPCKNKNCDGLETRKFTSSGNRSKLLLQ